MANSLVPADTPLFTFDQVKIEIQDLVRTGFMDKYNVLASAVISDITWRFEEEAGTAGTSGTSESVQILEFHTNDGVIEVPVAGGGGFFGDVCAIDVCYDDAQDRFDNVQEALDYLLNPYQAPTGTTTGAPGLKEVGDTAFYPITLTTTGVKKSKDLEYVRLTESGTLGGNAYTNNSIPAGSNGSVAQSYDLATNPPLVPYSPINYAWTGTVKDVENPATGAGSDSLRYVYPYYKFNNASQQTSQAQLESLINTGLISSILNSSATGPSQIQLDAATSAQFMHILVPVAYDDVTEIIDANLGLGSAPGWDTLTSPDPAAEFRREDVILTKTQTGNNAFWTNQPYRLYYSKIQKSNLSLIFKL